MLSHYRLLRPVGEGGMGVVWRARDEVLQRDVALKVLQADLVPDPESRRQFLEEARLASSVGGAHIAQVFEFASDGSTEFLVMEYVEGEPLSRSLGGSHLPLHRVADYGRQIAQAMAQAHQRGLLHRDLKPGNIMVTAEGDIKVVDFGLAMLFRRDLLTLDSEADTAPPDSIGALAATGLAGTVPYMSPEQLRGEPLDARREGPGAPASQPLPDDAGSRR